MSEKLPRVLETFTSKSPPEDPDPDRLFRLVAFEGNKRWGDTRPRIKLELQEQIPAEIVGDPPHWSPDLLHGSDPTLMALWLGFRVTAKPAPERDPDFLNLACKPFRYTFGIYREDSFDQTTGRYRPKKDRNPGGGMMWYPYPFVSVEYESEIYGKLKERVERHSYAHGGKLTDAEQHSNSRYLQAALWWLWGTSATFEPNRYALDAFGEEMT